MGFIRNQQPNDPYFRDRSWWKYVDSAARKYNVNPLLVSSIINSESTGDPSARSGAGAIGLMQLMPATARGLGVKDPSDPRDNIFGGTKFISQLLNQYGGNVRKALAAYNAGPGAVNRYGGVPPYEETRNYINKTMSHWGQTGHNKAWQYAAGLTSAGEKVPGTTLKSTERIEVRAPKVTEADIVGGPDEEYLNRMEIKYRSNPYALRRITMKHLRENPFEYVAPKITPGKYKTQVNKTVIPDHIPDWMKFTPKGANNYQRFTNLGQYFGLQWDNPGLDPTRNPQLGGGNHAAGSNHYVGRAADWGDARNSRESLIRAAKWARENRKMISELYYRPLGWSIVNGRVVKGTPVSGHGDHLHMAFTPNAWGQQ